ncbi:hypothetical protein AQ765_27240 [Burkholderia pseudomallei]|uniref:hypothetical protein n=1 Tax=Burkholderia pseudomallei TaxID=28450 RepID=UPI0005722D69|nr:hypothetical protein [Burkholderia pseudomallei]AJW55100.1 hypothetical protein UQ47_18310 [Burkholderia pseudomallei]ALC59338.1 hypothetical protein AMS56_20985 [Burkholderia pseudomallei]KYZ80732.1 hypothetical protein PTBPS01_23630 [Burkholderia pseudomallei]MCD4542844.1 hypothetical protein [Burkholderia pseudomallei]MCW0009127.1 hypothetical protein [Burkholderia pseudomallei]
MPGHGDLEFEVLGVVIEHLIHDARMRTVAHLRRQQRHAHADGDQADHARHLPRFQRDPGLNPASSQAMRNFA